MINCWWGHYKNTYFFSKINLQLKIKYYFCSGEMAEWSIAAVLKTVEQRCSGGSNPSFSAEDSKPLVNTGGFVFTTL